MHETEWRKSHAHLTPIVPLLVQPLQTPQEQRVLFEIARLLARSEFRSHRVFVYAGGGGVAGEEDLFAELFVDLAEDTFDGGEAAAEGAVSEVEVDFGDGEGGGVALRKVQAVMSVMECRRGEYEKEKDERTLSRSLLRSSRSSILTIIFLPFSEMAEPDLISLSR